MPQANALWTPSAGFFASGKVLQRYGVPFLYINNCRPGELEMLSGVARFVRTVSVTRAFASMRILLIGNRPKDFHECHGQ